MIASGACFVWQFPDAPIHPCVEIAGNYAIKPHLAGYCGKQGQSHTLDDYRAFQAWELAMSIVWPIGLGGLAISIYAKRKADKAERRTGDI
jgi:hypothetical protein